MATAEEALTELRGLVKRLDELGAPTLVDGIVDVLSAGVVRSHADARTSIAAQEHGDARPRRGRKAKPVGDYVQEGYLPHESVVVAVRLVLAAVEPLFMMLAAREILDQISGRPTEVRWEADRVDGAALDEFLASRRGSSVDEIPTPSLQELDAIKAQVAIVRKLCDELFSEVE